MTNWAGARTALMDNAAAVCPTLWQPDDLTVLRIVIRGLASQPFGWFAFFREIACSQRRQAVNSGRYVRDRVAARRLRSRPAVSFPEVEVHFDKVGDCLFYRVLDTLLKQIRAALTEGTIRVVIQNRH